MNKRQLSKLFQQHSDAIYRFAYWRVRDKEQAEDIVSIVFTKAWEKRDSFKGEHASAWLYTIARNTIIDGYRKYEPMLLHENTDIEADDETPQLLDKQFEHSRLADALDSLDDDMREVIQWRFLERFTVKETAERLDISEANVRVIQHRALKKLRTWYEKNQ